MLVATNSPEPVALVRPVGVLLTDPGRTALARLTKYTSFALTKFQTFLDHPQFISSAQNITDLPPGSRLQVDGVDIPGGGLRFPDGSFCVFSGFGTPEEDENAVLAAKVLVGDLTRSQAVDFAAGIGNQTFVTQVDYLIGHDEGRPASFRPPKRFGRVFADSAYTGGTPELVKLFDRLLEEKKYPVLAVMLGWSEGCPVVPLILQRGSAKEAVETYAELLLSRSDLYEMIRQANPALYRRFTSTRERLSSEPAGEFFRKSIPPDHDRFLRGAAAYAGYNLPRLLREFLGPRKHRDQNRFLIAYDIFDRVLNYAALTELDSPIEFVALLAEAFHTSDDQVRQDTVRGSQDPLKYLRRLFSSGKLSEDNAYTDHLKTLRFLRQRRSPLWDIYQSAPADALKERGIADLRSYL
jgi:hypothetical protein